MCHLSHVIISANDLLNVAIVIIVIKIVSHLVYVTLTKSSIFGECKIHKSYVMM